jgi:hypothetical protein
MRWDRVLFVGDAGHRDFAESWSHLRAQSAVEHAASPEAACELLDAGQASPHLIVVAQVWPGQFCQEQIEALHRAAPLARLVALLGSWCEGEACSGRPWTGVPRVYWHEFKSRVLGGRDASGGWQRVWPLPRTATDPERYDVACRSHSEARRGLVLISAADVLTYGGIAEACGQAGYTVSRFSAAGFESATPMVGGIWDDSSEQAGDRVALRQFASQLRPAPVVALLNFPRHFDDQRARQAGAAIVCGKPFLWDELLAELRSLSPNCDPSADVGHAA